MDAAKRGADALSAGHYDEAIQAYTEAIKSSPTSPDYFIKRSTSYQRHSPPDFSAAFSDAETAVILAQKRAKRELIVQAQLRRAIALYGLDRPGDAAFVLDIVKRMDPKEKMLAIWENKVKSKLEGLPVDDSRSKATVKETPEIDTSKTAEKEIVQAAKESTTSSGTAQADTKSAPSVSQTPANKIRHDWYQNADNVYFTLLAKGVPKDKATIDIQERALSISFPLNTGSTYDFSLEPLFAAVDISKSTISVLSTKVEIVLKKAQPGQKWHGLESKVPTMSTTQPTASTSTVQQPSASTAGPYYPTSSKSGPKNWDKLASDLTAKKTKKDDKTASGNSSTTKSNDDDDDDYDYDREDGDEVNGFFKKLYAGASPDVRKAMMKSFQESNGTALSTNWDEVSKGTVETQPPNGMEAKSWGT